MNIKSALKIASITTISAALMGPVATLADSNPQYAAAENSHSLVHRVSHNLANTRSYSNSGNAGYKWNKNQQPATPTSSWSSNTPSESGYKWGNSASADKPNSQEYASSANYQWGSMSFSEQSAYKWGLKSFSEQSAYKWGLKAFSEQSAYKWGLKSFSEQSAYKWGLKSSPSQSAYKWGLK